MNNDGFINDLCRGHSNFSKRYKRDPCGGGVEYLHRDPASRRRRRKGKSQNWDSKIWSRDPRDSDPRKTALARASSIYKRQTRPLVREGAPQRQDRNCQTIINIWSWAPLLTDRPLVAMWLWLRHKRNSHTEMWTELLHEMPEDYQNLIWKSFHEKSGILCGVNDWMIL
jgi:hypothetical protein